MDIKAILCDVDGTLLTDEGIASDYTIQAIKKAREAGIAFGLCTGRDVHSVKNLLKDWRVDGLVDIIVGTGGAEVCDFLLHKEEDSYPLDGKHIHEIIHHYEDMDVNFAIPYQGDLYAPKDDIHIQILAEADKIPYIIVNFNEFLSTPKPKVMIVCDPEAMDQVIERSKTFSSEEFKSSSLITASILYEYMDPRVTKTAGIEKVAKWRNWSLDNICTFGDADNDYDMTMNAGIGVVMKNGSERTKSVADYITDDNNHDGIGNFIMEHILK